MCHHIKATFLGLGAFCSMGLFNACKNSTRVDESPSGQGEKLRIMVSVPPLADLVRKVGGKHVHIDVLVDNGQDPHTFSPSPVQMKALGKADILLTVGMPFEETLVHKVSDTNIGITVVDASAGIEKLGLEHEHNDHEEENLPATGEGATEGTHDHHDHDFDPHVWLAPYSIKVQLENIGRALAKAVPEQAATFADNLEASKAQLAVAHGQIAGKLKPFAGREFFVFHPAFGYFAHEYDLEQIAIEIGGHSPTPKEMIGFLAVAKEANIKVIFVQPQFDPRSAEVIAKELGAKVALLNPLAPDVIDNLHAIADAIVAGFSDPENRP